LLQTLIAIIATSVAAARIGAEFEIGSSVGDSKKLEAQRNESDRHHQHDKSGDLGWKQKSEPADDASEEGFESRRRSSFRA
jgi:hypothetical protein